MKTLQEKIEELESDGWLYEDEFRLLTSKNNTSVQFMALTKKGFYRKIENGKIQKGKQYMSDEDIEIMGE
jgi:hypothetical protein